MHERQRPPRQRRPRRVRRLIRDNPCRVIEALKAPGRCQNPELAKEMEQALFES
jgi:hypothetical protein